MKTAILMVFLVFLIGCGSETTCQDCQPIIDENNAYISQISTLKQEKGTMSSQVVNLSIELVKSQDKYINLSDNCGKSGISTVTYIKRIQFLEKQVEECYDMNETEDYINKTNRLIKCEEKINQTIEDLLDFTS